MSLVSCKWVSPAVLMGCLLPAGVAWAQACQNVPANASLQMTAQEQVIYAKPCSLQAAPPSEVRRPLSVTETSLIAAQQTKLDFWENWTGQTESPALSTNTQSTYYGVGVWLPEKYQDTDIMTIEDAEQWIKNHGLQMSLGVGGKDGRSARFRLDYRWHEEDFNDLFLQVEIPFQ